MRRILLVLAMLCMSAPAARATDVDLILDNLQQLGFNYFWNEANPANGLIRDRMSGNYCSIASVGFGLSSICIGIDHGWITRAQGAARVQTTLNTFWTLPQGPGTTGIIGYKGFFYHFLHMSDGLRDGTSELSDIDTALLLAGILDCKQYFNGADPTEVSIRALADSIYRRVDWSFMQTVPPQPTALRFGWKPESGYLGGGGYWTGYNEMMIMYILAMGSPTHPLPASGWNTYTSTYPLQTWFGHTYVAYGSLFIHQYSHCWIDFRNKRDTKMAGYGFDYFENSRRATLAQQAYCIANPGLKSGYPDPAGYSATLWGLTAGDDPPPGSLYEAHGAPGPGTFDNGTIQPTAAIGSLPFAPEICRPTIQNMFDNYPALWGTYGLKDGFNLATNPDWYANDFLGIDQGPIVMMIENYRTGSVWSRFMQNPDVQAGMAAAGFVPTVDVEEGPLTPRAELWSAPNPFRTSTQIEFRLGKSGPVRLTVHDVTGREVARPVDGWLDAGHHSVILRGDGLTSGVYWYRLDTSDTRTRSRGVLMR